MQDKAQEGRKRYNYVNGDRSGLGLTYLFDTAQLLILWFLALFLFEQEEVLDVERLHILYLRYLSGSFASKYASRTIWYCIRAFAR